MKKVLVVLIALVASAAIFAQDAGYKPGSFASDFKLKNIDGKMVSLADYPNAKGFIVTFTCNHCPYAVAYEDRIIALHNKYASKGYPVIAINPNDEVKYPADGYSKMQERAKEKSFTFPYLRDESQEVAKKYGALKTPHLYILQKDSKKLSVEYVGAIDDNYEDASAVKEKYVEQAVDALLAGKPVATKSTKAIGCSIKWKSL